MMENVPVKIAERYKPPPSIRQHSVQLNLNKYKLNYYSDSPEFQYDFQLERKVLATVPEWRRMRRLNVEARRERQEKRKLQRIRVFEEKQKQLLGAVSYPSAEDLSSSSLDSGDEEHVAKQAQAQPTNQQEFSNRNNSSNGELAAETTAKQTANSFYNILQPTILTENNYKSIAANKCSTNTATESKLLHKSIVVGSGINNSSSFNYKDFEEDTSSPFDNIELKTINDLDILAQVLNNTQLQKNSDSVNNVVLEATGGDAVIPQEQIKNEQNSNEILRSSPIDNSTEPTVSQQQTPSIPMVEKMPELNQFGYPFQQNLYYTKQNVFQKPITSLHYQHSHQINTNMNYVISTNCNGYDVDQPNHQNSNNQLSSPPQQLSHHTTTNNRANFNFCTLQRFENENAAKSKSVPDIIRELSQEVCNSEKRRNRNYSQNLDNDLNTTTTVMQNAVSVSPNQSSYLDLSPELQKIVENISSMGFPLERVAKLIKKIGADDKKIIEHLIPLTELLDLGFDESKISEALLKYENNKEKALEYLIS